MGPNYQFPNVTEFFNGCFMLYMHFPNDSDGKESAYNAGDPGWPREFHGQRSLVGYSPWRHKESDMTE